MLAPDVGSRLFFPSLHNFPCSLIFPKGNSFLDLFVCGGGGGGGGGVELALCYIVVPKRGTVQRVVSGCSTMAKVDGVLRPFCGREDD